MGDIKKSLYNVAIGTQGFLLQGTPKRPARLMRQATVFGTRFASGDRDYTDFSFWWFWAQTDWSAGVKDEIFWKDDAKYYYSTNIDAFSEYGSIKLMSGLVLKNDFAEDITCGVYGMVGGISYHFIGTTEGSDGKPVIYRSTDGASFTNISSSAMSSLQTDVSYLKIVNGVLWAGTIGNGQTRVVQSYDGSTFTDHSSAILAASSMASIVSSSAIDNVGTDIYVGIKGGKTLSNTGDKSAAAIYGSTWTDPTNAYGSDNVYAVTTGTEVQVYGGFDFGTVGSPAVPVTAKIVGIIVKAEGNGDQADMEIAVRLSWDGGGAGTWTSWKTGTPNKAADTTVSFGSSTDTWGRNWISDEVRSGYLRVAIQCSDFGTGTQYNLDHLQVIVYYTADYGVSIMKYSAAAWSEIANWTENSVIFDLINYGNDIYYLKGKCDDVLEFRTYDITASADTLIQQFKCDFICDKIGSNKYLRILGASLIITIPDKEIWKYTVSGDTSTMERIWKRDDKKNAIGKEAVGSLSAGCIYHDYKLWWGNLIYDNRFFFNSKKDYDDSTTYFLYPIYTDLSTIKWKSQTDDSILYADSGYKGTADKNFLVFSQMETISTIDKLFYSVSILFMKLVSGQKILLKYSLDEMATWIDLGSVDYAVDGGSITNKTFYFPVNTIDKKIWIRIYLEGGGSNTPSLQDISMAYYPMPDYKQQWDLSVQCFDNLILLDGKTKEPKRGEELRNILKTFWKNKEAVDFYDIDYAETLLNGDLTAVAVTIPVDSTNSFPEQGIIKIENEKIKYTGRTALQFTGCVRGYEGTAAVSHSDNVSCSNIHKVIIANYQEQTPIGVKVKIGEFLTTLQLMEI